jgi:hypothetical protein
MELLFLKNLDEKLCDFSQDLAGKIPTFCVKNIKHVAIPGA